MLRILSTTYSYYTRASEVRNLLVIRNINVQSLRRQTNMELCTQNRRFNSTKTLQFILRVLILISFNLVLILNPERNKYLHISMWIRKQILKSKKENKLSGIRIQRKYLNQQRQNIKGTDNTEHRQPNGAQIQGTRSSWRINFVQLRLIFWSLYSGICFIFPFWRPEFWFDPRCLENL